MSFENITGARRRAPDHGRRGVFAQIAQMKFWQRYDSVVVALGVAIVLVGIFATTIIGGKSGVVAEDFIVPMVIVFLGVIVVLMGEITGEFM